MNKQILRYASLLIFGAYVNTGVAFADTALPIQRTITQADGSTTTAILRGDENYSFFEDTKGNILVKETNGSFRRATQIEKKQILDTWEKRFQERNASYIQTLKAQNVNTNGRRMALTGKKRALVILTQFSDVKFQVANTQAAFDAQFNQENYTTNGNVGSVHEYFYDQSNGQFDVTFDVVGPVTLNNTMAYYGAYDSKNDRSDIRPASMVGESVDLAEAQGIDFSQYDWDGDGKVENVFVVFADKSESESAYSDNIWAHKYTLYGGQYNYGDGSGKRNYDGVEIDNYACAGELNYLGNMSGVGTACHEFSHSLGLHDIYDITYNIGYGMQSWDIMHRGNHNNDGFAPCAYTSFERMQIGWTSPTVLSSPKDISNMPAITDEPTSYIIYNEGNTNEYYLLENRQKKSWDKGLDGHGLLIIHIDYDAGAWAAGAINTDPDHQRCTTIPADNEHGIGSYSVGGDAYPGTSANHSLTDTTTPAATLFNNNTSGKKLLSKSITNITETSGLISFAFMGGKELGQPDPKPATNVEASSFTANWSAASNAISYSLEILSKPQGGASEKTILSENFSKCTGQTECSGNLDSYMQQTGWTGSELLSGSGCMTLGASLTTGVLTSALQNTPKDGWVSIDFTEKYYILSGYSVTVSLVSSTGQELATQTINTENKSHTVRFTGITEGFKVRFTGKYTSLTAITVKCADDNTETTLVENLTTTSYIYNNVQAGREYSYRVKAVGEYSSTPWSAYLIVGSLTEGAYLMQVVNGGSTYYLDLAEGFLDNVTSTRTIQIANNKYASYVYLTAAENGKWALSTAPTSEYLKIHAAGWDITMHNTNGQAFLIEKADASTYYISKGDGTGNTCFGYNQGETLKAGTPIYADKAKDNTALKFSFTPIEEVTYDVTLNAIDNKSYATFYADEQLTLPEGVKGYYANFENDCVILRPIDGDIPAQTGIVLVSDEQGSVQLIGTTMETAAPIESNKFIGFIENTQVSASENAHYALNYKTVESSKIPGFFVPQGATTAYDAFTAKAHRAYLQLTSTEATDIKAFNLKFDDETDIFDIKFNENDDANGKQPTANAIYNLAGQRIQHLQKGLNIINGKKVIY